MGNLQFPGYFNKEPNTNNSNQPNNETRNDICSDNADKNGQQPQQQVMDIDNKSPINQQHISTIDENKQNPPQLLCRKWCRSIKREMRALDRSIRKMQAQEKKMKAEIKRESQHPDINNEKQRALAIRTMAKSVVQQNKLIAKSYALKTDMNSIVLQIKKQQQCLNKDEMYLVHGYTKQICGNLNVPFDVIQILIKYYKLHIFRQPSDVTSKLMDELKFQYIWNNQYECLKSIKSEMMKNGFIMDLSWREPIDTTSYSDDMDEEIDKVLKMNMVFDKDGDPPMMIISNDKSEEIEKRTCDKCDDFSCDQCHDDMRKRLAMLKR